MRAAGQGSVGAQRAAVPGFRLAGLDLVAFATGFQTPGEVQRAAEADLELAGEVCAEDELVIDQATGIKAGRRGCAIGGVQRVLGAEVQGVAAIDQAEVGAPSGDLALHTARQRQILRVDGDLGQEAVGVDGRHIVGVVGQAREGGAFAVAVLIAGPAIGLPVRIQRLAGVGEDGPLLDLGVAEAGGDGVGRHARIQVRAVGRLAVQIFGRQGQVTVGAKAQALPRRSGDGATVGLVALAARRLDRGEILAVGDAGPAALASFFQAQVDDAGDGVRAVLRRSAVAQDLDPVQSAGRDSVQIDGGRTATDRAVDVDQGRGVAARAVHQHQGLVRRQAAQSCGTDGVGAVIG
ncbi:hypothetical protein D3C72_1103730 [compost metagenome]